MSITKLEDNLNIIENLPDAPTLESNELKRKFDEGSIKIKDYINDVLTAEIDTLVTQIKKEMNDKLLEDNKKKYYVGKLIFDTKNVNPATYLGFGTWQLWGQGRVPVGVNSSDPNFSTVEKTGGASTVNIAHNHTINGHTHTINGHTHTTGNHTLTIKEMPAHSHAIPTYDNVSGVYTTRQVRGTQEAKTKINSTDGTSSIGGNAAHNHGNTGSTSLTTNSTSLTTNNGGSTSVNNLQPYITCFIWKRVS